MNESSKICPLCYSVIKETDDTVVCEKCGTPHHRNCWQHYGGCGNTQCGFRMNVSSQPEPVNNVQNSNVPPYNNQAGYLNQNAGMQQNQAQYAQNTYTQPPYNTTNNNYQYPQQSMPQKKKMSGGKIALIICSSFVAVIILIVVVAAVVALNAVGSVQKADYYKIGDNSIPSVKYVVGERKVTVVSTEILNNTTQKTYIFSNMSQYDAEKYVKYLRENNNFLTTGISEIAADASEQGKIIIMKIQRDGDGYKITITLGKGTLTKY